MKQSKPKTKKKSAAAKAITQKTPKLKMKKTKKKMMSKEAKERMVKSMTKSMSSMAAGIAGGGMKKIKPKQPLLKKRKTVKKK